jgi:hypothetical protein
MKDAFVLVVTAVLFFACTGPTVAQEVPLTPEMKKWEPLLGKWSYELEVRESPTAAWKKESGTEEYRSGGFYLEIRGLGLEGSSRIEIVGYDPIQRGYISSTFMSNGGRANVTSMDWSGTTLTLQWNFVTAEREVQIRRNTWEVSADFKSITGTLERFTDGEWWICGKAKGTKFE